MFKPTRPMERETRKDSRVKIKSRMKQMIYVTDISKNFLFLFLCNITPQDFQENNFWSWCYSWIFKEFLMRIIKGKLARILCTFQIDRLLDQKQRRSWKPCKDMHRRASAQVDKARHQSSRWAWRKKQP